MRFCSVLSTLCTCAGPERMRWPIESAPVATPLRTVSKPPLACPTTSSLAFLHCHDSRIGRDSAVDLAAQAPMMSSTRAGHVLRMVMR
jgi:hypothetical protein